jgi:hypothetical protein
MERIGARAGNGERKHGKYSEERRQTPGAQYIPPSWHEREGGGIQSRRNARARRFRKFATDRR